MTGNTHELEQAETSLRHAILTSSHATDLASFINKNLAEIASMNVHDKPDPAANWLVKVSSKSFYELRSQKQGLKGIKKALGPDIKKGDVCWIIFEDKYSEGGIWRLGAIMTAESMPNGTRFIDIRILKLD